MKRTWKDVVDTVKAMTGRKPNPGSKSFDYTRSILDNLCLSDFLDTVPIIHVAGTKGKGTTCTFASSLIEKTYNKKVGKFTSPHLFDVRERIQVNNKFIPKDRFTEYFFHVHDAIKAMTTDEEREHECAKRENFFRFMFILSLFVFQRENVEVAIIEVGIGGRLDTTNIIKKPAVCGITLLGMDHNEILGETIEEITREKAGIMKEGVLCFSNPQVFHPSTRSILLEESQKHKSFLVFVDPGTIPSDLPKLKLTGPHYRENALLGLALARTVCGVPVSKPLSHSEYDTLANVTMDGRAQEIDMSTLLQNHITTLNTTGSEYDKSLIPHSKSIDLRKTKLFLDGAHNPESIHAMADSDWYFPNHPTDVSNCATVVSQRRIVILYSTRDPASILQGLVSHAQHIDRVIFALIPSPRQIDGVIGAYAQDILRNTEFVEQCTVMLPNVPCYNCTSAFLQIQDIFDMIDVTSEKMSSAERAQCVPDEIIHSQDGADILFTGSILFVGHVLKMIKESQKGTTC